MNRRNFVSMLLGSAGAGVVLWRLPQPRIVLPPRVHTVEAIGMFRRPDELDADFRARFLEGVADAARVPVRILTYAPVSRIPGQDAAVEAYLRHVRFCTDASPLVRQWERRIARLERQPA